MTAITPITRPASSANDSNNNQSSETTAVAALALSAISNCPICRDTLTDAFMTPCGHSFCFGCIQQHLSQQRDCPVCRMSVKQSEIYPNLQLNDLIEQQRQPLSNTVNDSQSIDLKQYLNSLPHTEDIQRILTDAVAKREQSRTYEQGMRNSLLSYFMKEVEKYSQNKIGKWRHRLDQIHRLEELSPLLSSSSPSSPSQRQQQQQQEQQQQHQPQNDTYIENATLTVNDANDLHDNSLFIGSRKRKFQPENTTDAHQTVTSMQPTTTAATAKVKRSTTESLSLSLATRKPCITQHFNDLMDLFFSEQIDTEKDLESFSSTLYQITSYSRFVCLDTIHFTNVLTSSAIVSCIEFDSNEDYIAAGGVTKEIKFYDFNAINKQLDISVNEQSLHDPNERGGGAISGGDNDEEDDDDYVENDGVDDDTGSLISSARSPLSEFVGRRSRTRIWHCPLRVIQCDNKISCLSWNPYVRSMVASSDYEGGVNLWDATTGQSIRTFQEHQRRAWSIDTCTNKPTQLASGSDDGTVKIWSINSSHSELTLQHHGNICCAKFAPKNTNHIAIGSADHHITCYDLRQTKKPLQTFSGHQKAVSYVRWNSDDEITSASTDSTLKSWRIGNDECIRTYQGHQNEKNFVGLSLTNNWMACGSEDNTLYSYHKNCSQPVAKYKFPLTVDPITGTENHSDAFVSSVCFKKDGMKVAVGNSKGVIKILQLVQ